MNCVLGTNKDINEHKQGEEELSRIPQDLRRINADLKRSAQELSLLDQVRVTLGREMDMTIILHTVVEAITKTFNSKDAPFFRPQGWLESLP